MLYICAGFLQILYVGFRKGSCLHYNSHQRQILQQLTNIRCELQQLMHTKR